ncbi:MAG: hypothetical protein WCQ67_04945 [Treponema sp.]
MAKKNVNNLLYIIGCALVVVGFFTPIFQLKTVFGNLSSSGFGLVKQFNNASDTLALVATLLVFIGAVAGIVCFFISKKSLWNIVCLAVSILGGLILFANTSDLGINFAGNFLSVGFYLIVIGWVVSIVGIILSSLKK